MDELDGANALGVMNVEPLVDPFDVADPCDIIEANEAVLMFDAVRAWPPTPFVVPSPSDEAVAPDIVPLLAHSIPDLISIPPPAEALVALLGRRMLFAGLSPARLGTRSGITESAMGTDAARNRTLFLPSGDGVEDWRGSANGRGGMVGVESPVRGIVLEGGLV